MLRYNLDLTWYNILYSTLTIFYIKWNLNFYFNIHFSTPYSYIMDRGSTSEFIQVHALNEYFTWYFDQACWLASINENEQWSKSAQGQLCSSRSHRKWTNLLSLNSSKFIVCVNFIHAQFAQFWSSIEFSYNISYCIIEWFTSLQLILLKSITLFMDILNFILLILWVL